ncbi:MAG: LPS export ABC transporter periplasmic protein LptC [Hyphomicrobiales bacterium]
MAGWFALVALAAGAGLGLTFLVQLGVFSGGPISPPPQAPVQKPNQITSGASEIAGFDKNKLPFLITAKHGEQDVADADLVHLSDVVSDFARPSGEKLNVTSKLAHYQTKTKALNLEGDVVFTQGTRFTARMDKASVNMDDQSLQSQSPVDVNIIGGRIAAPSLTISANGERILFQGGVKAQFVTQKEPTGDGQ